MKVVIVGFGEKGRRHARIAQSLGLKVVAVDPVVRDELVVYSWLSQALEHEWGRVQAIVIATPPEQQLGDIELAEHAGLPVLLMGEQDGMEAWQEFLQTCKVKVK